MGRTADKRNGNSCRMNDSQATYNYSGRNRIYNNGRGKTVHRSIVRLVKLWDVILVSLPFAAAWMFYYSHMVYIHSFYRKGNWVVIGLFTLLYYLLSHLYSGYTIHISRISEIVYAQTLGAMMADGIMFIVMWLLIRHVPSIPVLLVVFGIQFLIIIEWATFAHKWYFKNKGHGTMIADVIADGQFYDHVENTADYHSTYIRSTLVGVEAVFLCCLHSHDRNQIVKYCVHKDIVSWCIPRIGDVIMEGADKAHLFHLPMLRVARYNPTPEYLVAKRAFDILVAGTALVVFSPLMIVLALLIRMDGGTAFYRQKRLTKDGKVFEILKFRSMRMDAEKDGVARLSSGDADPRITKVGRFIRACRFDELPQLFNILAGDMSIVGPRPERPEIAREYKKELPEFDLRLQCKCGLTGFAQVYGKYNTTPYDKLLMDLMYIAQPSMIEDLKICFATVKILFMKDSTEGVEVGQVTAVKRMFTAIESDPAINVLGAHADGTVKR